MPWKRKVRDGWRTYRKKTRPRYKKKWNKKTKSYHDKLRKTNDALLRLGKKPKNTLKARVRALEGNQSKHWDTIQTGYTVPHKINWNGVSFTGIPPASARNSFGACLDVTPVLPNGEVQRFSDSFEGRLENQRTGREIFAKSLRLRGKLMGLRPRARCIDISGLPLSSITDPWKGVADSDTMLQNQCYTKIWMVVLQDMRPSIVDTNGLSQANPYDPAGSGSSPIESIAQYTAAGDSTLEVQGYGQMLKSYESTRFKVRLAKAYVTTFSKPMVEFDVTLDINKQLKYDPLPYDQAPPSQSTKPLNYNLLVYFLWNSDTTGSIDYTKFHAPETKFLTSRLKFLDN